MYYVGFGEASPEKKAAKNLHDFFTYIAVRIVTAQLEVPPFLAAEVSSVLFISLWLFICMISSVNNYFPEQSYSPEAYEELMEFLSRHSLNDGDKFCAELMRESSRHKGLGNANHTSLIGS